MFLHAKKRQHCTKYYGDASGLDSYKNMMQNGSGSNVVPISYTTWGITQSK